MPTTSVEAAELRSAVRDLCSRFPDDYWRDIDLRLEYPKGFVDALTEAGYLAAFALFRLFDIWKPRRLDSGRVRRLRSRHYGRLDHP